MNKQELKSKIAKLQEQLKELEAKEQEKKENVEWLDLGNGKEISTKQLYNGKTYAKIKALLKEGEEIADYPLLQKLRNEEVHPCFKDFWVFVPNPDKISEKNGYVAWFGADSDRAWFFCIRDPSIRVASLGVFIVRKISRGKKRGGE